MGVCVQVSIVSLKEANRDFKVIYDLVINNYWPTAAEVREAAARRRELDNVPDKDD